jgi:hypothetical protein
LRSGPRDRNGESGPALRLCEHLFVTSQGSAHSRLRRAVDTRNATIALAAAAELDYVGLSDALELVLLLLAQNPTGSAARRSAGTPATATSSGSTWPKPKPCSHSSRRSVVAGRSRPRAPSPISSDGNVNATGAPGSNALSHQDGADRGGPDRREPAPQRTTGRQAVAQCFHPGGVGVCRLPRPKWCPLPRTANRHDHPPPLPQVRDHRRPSGARTPGGMPGV